MRKKAIRVITAVLILLSCAGCGKQAEPADRSFFALDTYITMLAQSRTALPGESGCVTLWRMETWAF